MDNLVLGQKRMKFSGSGREKQEELEGIRERRGSPSFQQTEYLKEENKAKRQYSSSQMMSEDHDAREIEFATAVAAAAFAVHSLDQAEQQYQKRKQQEALEMSRSKARSRKDEIKSEIPSSGRANRMFLNKEARTVAGQLSRKSSSVDAQQDKVSERAYPARQPSRASSVRQAMPANRSPGHNGVESKADAWEKAQIKEVQNRYEKRKSAILGWENEKKMRAKLKMDKRKSLLDQRRGQNMQHYQNKIVRIEQIAGGARAQLEEKRRNKELAVKDKARKLRSGGKVPVKCFCFTC